MREIDFRLKDRISNKWYYGYPMSSVINNTVAFKGDKRLGSDYFDLLADATTLGQYIGLNDKNNIKIYDGDIVKILYTDWASKSDNDTRTLEEYLDSLTKVGVVCWDNLSLCYHLKMKNDCFSSIHCGKYGYIEVIGNIHDNPELLEGDDE